MRAANTYRSERRNDWASYRRLYRGIAGTFYEWRAFNEAVNGDAGYGVAAGRARAHSTTLARSKRRPHNGKREMERRRRQLTA